MNHLADPNSTTLLLSDIHGNIHALEAVLSDAKARFGEFDAVCVLGDVVGYGAHPNEVVELIFGMEHSHVVKGNHEAAALAEISTQRFNPVAAEAAVWTRGELTQENARRLRDVPLVDSVGDLTLCHGSPRDPIWEYMFSATELAGNLAHFTTAGCAFGHTHVPCFFGFRGNAVEGCYAQHDAMLTTTGFDRWYVNPGSVGQPRDGDSRASYAVMRSPTSASQSGIAEYRFQFHRVSYDIEAAQQGILDAGLPPVLAFRLSEGRKSTDGLPEPLKSTLAPDRRRR